MKVFALQCMAAAVHAVDVSQVYGDSASNSTSTGAADGIWTNNDWSNTEIGVTNGVPYGITDEINQKIAASQVLMGQFPSDYDSQTNVTLVKSIITQDIWNQSFPFNNTLYTYNDFLRSVAKFPMFCNEVDSSTGLSLTDACKLELATLLAHISYETGSLQAVAQDGCSDPYNI